MNRVKIHVNRSFGPLYICLTSSRQITKYKVRFLRDFTAPRFTVRALSLEVGNSRLILGFDLGGQK